MVGYESWSVVVVPFPFTDRKFAKRRPALVLSTEAFQKAHGHVVLAMITSAKQSDWPTDVPILDLETSGLPTASVVRFKLFTLDQRFILSRVGTLAQSDHSRVFTQLRHVLQL